MIAIKESFVNTDVLSDCDFFPFFPYFDESIIVQIGDSSYIFVVKIIITTVLYFSIRYSGYDLRVRLGEWDVNHDVEFFPYIERDVASVHVHPEYYAGTLDNDLAILKLTLPVDFQNNPHISPACLPDRYTDFTGQRCWTTGWGMNIFFYKRLFI